MDRCRLISAIALLSFATSAQALTYSVNSSLDTTDGACTPGDCTLRDAITVANAAGGGKIQFAIGSGPVTITLASALPDLTTPIVLDGTTQPGYAGSPLVAITGSSTSLDCLVVRASNSVVRGLDLGTCRDGVAVLSEAGTAVTNVALERNFIGTRLATAPIQRNAIRLDATGTSTLSGVTIGNATPAGRNLLATFGFALDSLYISGNTSDVTVAGNYFGIDDSSTPLLTASRFITDLGLYTSAGSSNIVIGGSTAADRNVFGSGGGTQANIKIDALGSGLTIEGNYIGTDATGMVRMGASTFGVWFFGQGTATIRNNVITTTGNSAISRGVTTTGPVTVQGNWINVKADGTAFPFVPGTAINDFSSAPGYVIGGPNPGDGNVIVSYSTAVFVESPGALVQGNLLGLDPTGTNILGSGARGIATSFARTEPGVFFRDNKIAGFTTGIEIGSEALATVESNDVGTDAAGAVARPNTTGIAISGAAGRATVSGNLISGNTGQGITISTTTMPVSIAGNRIGVSAGGGPLPNGGDGIRVTSGTAAKQIGFLAGNANLIANNGGAGVNVQGGNATSILGNSIFDNAGLGIDLGTAGVNLNDAGDADTGANGLQNAPLLLSASSGAGGTTVQGSLASTPNTIFTIELFANAAADPSNYGEAQTFLARFNVTTDGGGNALFSTLAPLVAPGTLVSASATNTVTLETSELSNDVAVVSGGTLQFSAAASSVDESAGTITITVTRTGGSVPATVDYASADGTATAGSDYTAVAGTLNFSAVDTSQSFTVPITNDALDEPDETFTVSLSNVTGGSLGASVLTTVTINDDDAPPAVSVSDASVAEGDSGTSLLSFDVQLSAASAQTVTVDYSTADQTATAGADYVQRFGTLTFAPGETAKSVAVLVNGDVTTEPDETLRLILTSPANAAIADGLGTGTIVNDDGPPEIAIGDTTVVEGDSGTSTATLTVTLSHPSSAAVSVHWTTTAGTATAGPDFDAASGTVTFAPGVTAQAIDVAIRGDLAIEGPEQLTIDLSSPSGGTIADAQGLVTITDDDAFLGLFHTVAPCRLVDTRSASQGPAPVSGEVLVVVAQGSCGLPATARALAVNVTVTAAAGEGTLTLWDGDGPAPGTWTVAFTPFRPRSNNDIVRLAADASGSFALSPTVAGGGSVEVIIDVSGYFE